MEEEDLCLRALRIHRVSLVDELEGRIDSILDGLVSREIFDRDDREEVLCELGPRKKVRKVLDIVEQKGEEHARTFLTISNYNCCESQRPSAEGDMNQTQTIEYQKTKQKHKQVLKRRSESMLYYNTRHGEKIPFSQHYVNLLLVNGHQGLELKRHEILAFGQQRLSLQHKTTEHRQITPAELFSSADGNNGLKKILVTGVAGIGKTILVQKMLLDFGNSEDHLAFDFIIHLTFRDLNLINKTVNFRDLVLRKNGHLAKDMDNILANDNRLLIILDGFDEFRHCRCCDVDVFVTEPEEDGEVVEVIASLMQGELLPNASVMLTSRPTAISHIPVGCIDRFVLIAGFSLTEVRNFFKRYFQEKTLAERMFAVVVANELLLTLCYIPAFCYIVCCILKENQCTGNLKTMTDIYVQYLVALIQSHTQNRVKTSLSEQRTGELAHLSDIVLRLGRLAFMKLMDQQTLFYGSDQDVMALVGFSLVSTFLDKTVAQEPGCTEDVYSFTHLTVQEFFAAVYCAMTDHPLPDAHQQHASHGQETSKGHLDLLHRFLAGILSERNAQLLSRQVGLCCHRDKAETFSARMVGELGALCESGGHVLNHLHCLFEQQEPSLAQALQPHTLRINVSDESLSPLDYRVLTYFLNLTEMKISELDLTGTDIGAEALRGLQPHLLRCERLWLGENSLDMDSVYVIADVLQMSDNLINLGLGWADIGDEELFVLSDAIRRKQTLRELWMEGNRITFKGLLSLRDLTPEPLTKVVAIWNDFDDKEGESLLTMSNTSSFTVNFTDDNTWEEWGEWVINRCKVTSDEKLVTVLYKVCNISACRTEILWAKTFYKRLGHLVDSRIEQCTEDEIRRKLEKFQSSFSF